MAVGYHEFDLAIPEQRWAAQELVHLAMIEPGENMVDTQYNGVDFPLPVGWGVEVPKKGQFSFYYCREQEVIEKVLKYGSYDGSDYPYNVDGEIPVLHRSHYGIWYLKVSIIKMCALCVRVRARTIMCICESVCVLEFAPVPHQIYNL
jgi:hypothetical protein